MKKKYLIITVCLIAIAVVAAVTFYISLFFIGNPRSDALYVDRISVDTHLIELDGGTSSSAEAYKNFEYNIKR